jgi:probable addiction module antidote protein
MAKTKTHLYDAAVYLTSEEDCALYLQAVINESKDDPTMIVTASGEIVRARGMMQLANETGIIREGLYKALSLTGNPSFATIMKVCKAMGLRLRAEAVR